MRIGIDIMGGDYAPDAIVTGAISAQKLLTPNVRLVLVGDENAAKEIIKVQNANIAHFDFVHTKQVIAMGENPAKAYAKKTDSSIAVGFQLLKQKEIDGFASAGNTGAMMVGATLTIKVIPGVLRPAIATAVPKPNGKNALLLDIGLNPDCKPDVLYQYAVIGSVYAENVYNIQKPKVGLMNIGSEGEKGNKLAKATYELMKKTTDFNFIGNIEGNDVFSEEKADVMVCDGFVGNIILKFAESVYSLIKSRRIEDSYFEKLNFEQFGGTPVLGVNSPVMIAHGVSNANAIKNMILHTKDIIDANLLQKFHTVFNH